MALLAEWKEIDELCNHRDEISYKIVKKNKDDLPIEFEITYNIPSFISLHETKKINNPELEKTIDKKELFYEPVFGHEHHLQIIIPPNFPQVSGKPKGKIISPIWHPNVVCHGDDNIMGRVCFNEGNLDASVTIADRIVQVAEYLTYHNYLAEDREPHPYDTDVAYWIREIAEPMNWVMQEHGIMYEKFGIDKKEGIKEIPAVKAQIQPEAFKDEDILIIDDDEINSQDESFTGDWEDFIERGKEEEDDDEVLNL